MTFDVFTHLLESALRTTIVATAAALLLTLFRVRDISTRLAVWSAVLCAAFLMPFAGHWLPPLAAPYWQTSQAELSVTWITEPGVGITETQPTPSFPWRTVIVFLYAAVTAAFLARWLFGWVLAARFTNRTQSVYPQLAVEVAATVGLRRVPELRQSTRSRVPVTLGWFRPVVLLPAQWSSWNQRTLRAVLLHEFAHIAHKDWLVQRLGALHAAVFWFSPASWCISRQLTRLAEHASDDKVLADLGDPPFYAELLHTFLRARARASHRIAWDGVAMARGASTVSRIERILSPDLILSQGVHMKSFATQLAILIPVFLLAACARLLSEAPPPPPPPAPPATQAAAAPPDPPTPPRAAAIARPYAPPAPQARPENRDSYAIFYGDKTSISGSWYDVDEAKVLRKSISGDFIWFRRNGKNYVIRDAAIIQQARSFFRPQEELGHEQAELGKMQAALGKQQAELGKLQSDVAVQVPDMSADLQRVMQKIREASKSQKATQSDLGNLQADLAKLQARLGALEGQAGGEHARLGGRQAALGRQQATLGVEQAKLGERQREAAEKATAQMKELIESAIKDGRAQAISPLI